PSRTTHGRQIAYSPGSSNPTTTDPSRRQCSPSSDSAYLMTCRMSASVRPQPRFDPYHIRQRPPSRSTHGYDSVNGSASDRSSSGASDRFTNGPPGSSRTASPMLLRHGTVPPRFH